MVQIKRARQRGNKARLAELYAEIKQKPLPLAAWPIWQTFSRLSVRRGSSGFGPSPIGWGDLDAFQRMTGIGLTPWEIEMIEMLDGVYLGAMARHVSKQATSDGLTAK